MSYSKGEYIAILTNAKMLQRATLAKSLIEKEPGITNKELLEKMNIPRRSLFGILDFLVEEKHAIKLRSLKDARMFKYYPCPETWMQTIHYIAKLDE